MATVAARDDLDRKRRTKAPARSGTDDEFDPAPAAVRTSIGLPRLAPFAKHQALGCIFVVEEVLVLSTAATMGRNGEAKE